MKSTWRIQTLRVSKIIIFNQWYFTWNHFWRIQSLKNVHFQQVRFYVKSLHSESQKRLSSTSKILCEITFDEFRVSKNVIFNHWYYVKSLLTNSESQKPSFSTKKILCEINLTNLQLQSIRKICVTFILSSKLKILLRFLFPGLWPSYEGHKSIH